MKTSLYSILCIVVRLGAVMLFVETVASLPAAWQGLQVWMQTSAESDDAARGMLIGFSGAAIVLSFLLWLYPGLLARLAAGKASREVFESPVAPKELQFIAFSVLGVAFTITSLTGLVAVLFRIALSARFGDVAFPTLVWQNGASVLVQAIQFAAGIGLTYGACGLTGLLHRLREGALFPPVRSDEDAGPPLS